MRASHFLLVAIFCALSLSAHGQALVFFVKCDHDWSIHYGAQQFGLVQESWTYPSGTKPTSIRTTIWLGPHHFYVNHTVWPVAAVFSAPFICIGWLLLYGLGSVFKSDKKPPPPNPSPPP